MQIFQTILDSLFPDACVGCGVSGRLLCASCLARLPSAAAPEEDFITSIFSYKDFRVRQMVRTLKYKHGRRVAKIFAPAMAATLVEFLGEEGLFLDGTRIALVPVPLSKKRRGERGYNQAELLARATLALMPASSRWEIVLDTKLLEKVAETRPQAEIRKRAERLRNLGNCFRVPAELRSAGQTVILIDDVTTTGATLVAARNTLLRSGFRTVHALTLAH